MSATVLLLQQRRSLTIRRPMAALRPQNRSARSTPATTTSRRPSTRQVGHRLRRDRAHAGARQGAQACSQAPWPVRAQPRDRLGDGYITLNLMQDGIIEKATCTDISEACSNAGGQRAAPRPQRPHRARRRRGLPFPSDESFDLVLGTPCCTTSRTSRPASASSPRAQARRVFLSSPWRAVPGPATRSPPTPSAAPARCRRSGARCCGPSPPTTATSTARRAGRPRALRGVRRRPRLHARRARRVCEDRAVRRRQGPRRGAAAGQLVRLANRTFRVQRDARQHPVAVAPVRLSTATCSSSRSTPAPWSPGFRHGCSLHNR